MKKTEAVLMQKDASLSRTCKRETQEDLPTIKKVAARLAELYELKPAWLDEAGQSVRWDSIEFAMNLLLLVMDRTSPLPDIVPGTRGDLQIEWHTSKGDLELQIVRPNLVHAWLSIVGEADELEVQLTNDFQTVSDWLAQINENETATHCKFARAIESALSAPSSVSRSSEEGK